MLHLTNALLVCPFLLLFTPLVAFRQWDVSEALGKRVKHLYIKESPLPPIPPKNSSLDVNPGVVGSDCTMPLANRSLTQSTPQSCLAKARPLQEYSGTKRSLSN